MTKTRINDMTTLFFSYKDLARLAWNYLSMHVKFHPYSDNSHLSVHISFPRTGARKLLTKAATQLDLVVSLEVKSETELKINVWNSLSACMELQQVLVQYINHQVRKPILHLNFIDEIFVYLESFDIRLQSVTIAQNGLKIRMKDNAELKARIKMIRMLLRAGYEFVHCIRFTDDPSPNYFFSDDSLEYCLLMAPHPADIAIQITVPVPDWLIDDRFRKDMETHHNNGVHTRITMEDGYLTINMPVIIAEKQINATTIRRAVTRMKDELAPFIADMLFCRDQPPLDDPTISLPDLDLDLNLNPDLP